MGEGAAPNQRRRGSPVIYPASRLWIAGKQGAGDSSPPPVGWKMAKIILAEDDNDMRRFLVKALQNAGYDVISFDNGLSAYQRLREEPFELLLTDIVMPEMDGIELARRRARPRHQDHVHHRVCGGGAQFGLGGAQERQGPVQAGASARTRQRGRQ